MYNSIYTHIKMPQMGISGNSYFILYTFFCIAWISYNEHRSFLQWEQNNLHFENVIHVPLPRAWKIKIRAKVRWLKKWQMKHCCSLSHWSQINFLLSVPGSKNRQFSRPPTLLLLQPSSLLVTEFKCPDQSPQQCVRKLHLNAHHNKGWYKPKAASAWPKFKAVIIPLFVRKLFP